jgi:hypothetical protein
MSTPRENAPSTADESLLTVVVAFAANLLIAVAKTVAAVITGSASAVTGLRTCETVTTQPRSGRSSFRTCEMLTSAQDRVRDSSPF